MTEEKKEQPLSYESAIADILKKQKRVSQGLPAEEESKVEEENNDEES